MAANPRAEWWTTSDVAAYLAVQVATVTNYRKRDRMYETMVYWETASTGDDQPAVVRDYARIWQAADKVVYSSTLDAVSSARTRLEREFDPDAVRRLKKPRGGTSPSGVRGSRRARSRPAWWTSVISSSTPSWWAGDARVARRSPP